MISDLEAARAIYSIGLLFMLWALFSVFYRGYRVDLLRERLFELRAELFDLAADDKLQFDDDAYGQLRSMLNGHIRFAHRLSLGTLILFFFRTRREIVELSENSANEWFPALETLPEETALKLEEIKRMMHRQILKHLVMTSWALCPIAPFVGLVFGCRSLYRKTGLNLSPMIDHWRSKTRARFFGALDSAAYGLGGAEALGVAVG